MTVLNVILGIFKLTFKLKKDNENNEQKQYDNHKTTFWDFYTQNSTMIRSPARRLSAVGSWRFQ